MTKTFHYINLFGLQVDETYLDELECPGRVVDEAKFIDHFPDGCGELVVVALLLHHVWEQVINQGHEKWLILIWKTKYTAKN